MNETQYTVGSLFSGIGGIEIAFEEQGFKTEWFVENEPYAQAVLQKRFPETKVYADITKIDFTKVPRIDILTGGFPCQDISGAGKRIGIEGSRSSLWKYYAKAIRILRPKFALIENVSALAIRGLDVVLSDLAQIGYDAEWYNMSASAVGAPHQRERIFIIAYPNGNRESNESIYGESRQGVVGLSNSSGVGWDNGSNNREERQVQDAEERSTQEDKSEGDRLEYRSGDICKIIPNSYNQRQSGKRQEQMGYKELSYDVENSDGNRITERFGKDDLRRSKVEEQTSELSETSSRHRGIWATEPRLGRVAHGISHRVDKIKCLGNAVVPQCAEVFAQTIKMRLQEMNK